MLLLSFKPCHLVDMYPLCRDKTICKLLEEHLVLYHAAAITSLAKTRLVLDVPRMSRNLIGCCPK